MRKRKKRLPNLRGQRRKVNEFNKEKQIKKTQVVPVVPQGEPVPIPIHQTIIIQHNSADTSKPTNQKLPPPPPKKKIEWEKPTQNYINNYGPSTMYANFNYKNMNYEQLAEARKRAFIKEQNGN